MKAPEEMDFNRASSSLSKFIFGVMFAKRLGLGFGAGESNGPIAPSQIMERASVARASCDWDKVAILSSSCLLVLLSVLPVDSRFILSTSCET